MANKKISQLEQAQAVSPDDLLAIVQRKITGALETRKITVEELLASCSGGIGSVSSSIYLASDRTEFDNITQNATESEVVIILTKDISFGYTTQGFIINPRRA